MVTAQEVIKTSLQYAGITQAEAAKKIGYTPLQLSKRITAGTLRADKFLELMDAIGIDITYTVQDTGEVVKAHIRGDGRRVRQMINGTFYDTRDADALSNNFYADGVNEYQEGHAFELYITREGEYLLAEYSEIDGVKDRISIVTPDVAVKFLEQYGNELHRGQKEG